MVLQTSKDRRPMRALDRTCVTRGEVVARAKARMAELGKTQSQYAEFIGISQSLMSQILAQVRSPSDELLKDLRLQFVDHYEGVRAK
jgi:predicted transcriptional regulator